MLIASYAHLRDCSKRNTCLYVAIHLRVYMLHDFFFLHHPKRPKYN
jgi:hypothetical protein